MAAALWPLLQPQRDAIAARIATALDPSEMAELQAQGAALGPAGVVELLESVVVA